MNGKICYLEIPATNPERSAEFYRASFGWNIKSRDDGHISFDDTTGEVSGAFVPGRPPSTAVGLLVYIMVDDIQEAIGTVTRNGAVIVQPLGMDAPELTARFTDPGGNVLGLYQEPV